MKEIGINRDFLSYIFFLISFILPAQKNNTKKSERIKMYASLIHLDEKYPDLAFATDSIAVIFMHKGNTMKCDSAIFNRKEQYFEAFGNVKVNMGDTVFMSSDYLNYNGKTRFSKSHGNVVLKNRKLTLNTEELFFDRIKNEAYYNDWGTVQDEDNILVSKRGVYYVTPDRVEFMEDVNVLTNINNESSTNNFIVNSPYLIYYPKTKDIDFKGSTTIKNRDNPTEFISTEEGTYNTKTLVSSSTRNGSLHYNHNILQGDQLYFNQKTGYGKADGNVKLTRPLDHISMRGDHGEYYRSVVPEIKKDSVFIYSRAYAAKAQAKDSIYFHARRIENVQHPDSTYTLRGFTKAYTYNADGQAKADSLVYHDRSGIMELYKDPVLWYKGNQITGDSLRIYFVKNKIDSAVSRSNSMVINKVDSIKEKELNQIKGRNMYATFRDIKNNIDFVHVEGNAQSLIYVDEKKEGKFNNRIGINRSICAYIDGHISNHKLVSIACRGGTKSVLSPEDKVLERNKYLKGMSWRGKEQFKSKKAFMDYVKTVTDDVKYTPKSLVGHKKTKGISHKKAENKPVTPIKKEIINVKDKIKIPTQLKLKERLIMPLLPDYFLYDAVN